MYLRTITIEGIRSVDRLTVTFDAKPGWNVLVGANGSGKSTVVRALALALLGDRDVESSRVPLGEWIRHNSRRSRVEVTVDVPSVAMREDSGRTAKRRLRWKTDLVPELGGGAVSVKSYDGNPSDYPWNSRSGTFSASFGAFRRLSGGDKEYEGLMVRKPKLGAHLSALNDGTALVEAENWLREMHVEELEAVRDLRRDLEEATTDLLGSFIASRLTDAGKDAGAADDAVAQALERGLREVEERINARLRLGAVKVVRREADDASEAQDIRVSDDAVSFEKDLTIDRLSLKIVAFLNRSLFLFDGVRITGIRKDRILVATAAGTELSLQQLSDGYRSVLALGLEILRLMREAHGLEEFQHGLDDRKGVVTLAGIVVIDEVEAHLHPPWQERLGDWLQQCFPRVQFIVTTHSPIVCRPVARRGRMGGGVWQLPCPDGATKAERITGARLDRLVYGDILEAVGTDAFGRAVEQSEASTAKLERLAELNRDDVRGSLDEAEEGELLTLRRMFPTRSMTLG